MNQDGDLRRPITDVLGQPFEIHPLPPGWTPLEGIVLDETDHCEPSTA